MTQITLRLDPADIALIGAGLNALSAHIAEFSGRCNAQIALQQQGAMSADPPPPPEPIPARRAADNTLTGG